jgi:hypothetical protein
MADRRLPVGSLIIAGLVVALVLTTCGARRAGEERDAVRDTLRTEELAHRADSLGWAVRVEAALGANRSMMEVLQEREDSLDLLSLHASALAREVELLGGRLLTVSRMYAEAVGSIERHEAVVHRSDLIRSDQAPDSITGHVSDGLLEADVTATIDPPSVALPRYSVALELVTAVTETPDGRALFTARAGDPRVTIAHRETYWQPPAPVEFCSVGTKLKAAGVGGGLVEVTHLIARLFNLGG